VGLSRYAITHWVTSSNFMDSHPIPKIWAYLGAIRVDAPVTRRTPHSAGREGLPHPVPRF
jgi:hypothetical protein